MHKAYRRTVGTVILKIESVHDKLQSQHVELLYDNKHSITQSLVFDSCILCPPINGFLLPLSYLQTFLLLSNRNYSAILATLQTTSFV